MGGNAMCARRAAANMDAVLPHVRLFGISFWIAWQLVMFGCEIPFNGVMLTSAEVATVFVVNSLAFSLFLMGMGVFHHRFHALLNRFWFVTLAGLVASVGTVLVFLLEPCGPYWFLVGPAMTGVGTSVVAARGLMLFAELGPKELVVFSALTQLVGFLLDYTTLSIMTVCRPWLFFLLPLFSAVTLFLGGDAPSPVPANAWHAPKGFWKFVVGIFFFAIPVSICRACFPLSYDGIMLVEFRRLTGVLALVAMTLVIVGALTFLERFKLGRVFYNAMLVVAFLYVAFPLLGFRNTAVMGVTMGMSGTINAVLNLCVWVLLARISFKSGAPTVRVFGFGFGAFTLGSIAGWLVGHIQKSIEPGFDVVMPTLVVATLAVLFVAMFLFKRSDLEAMMEPNGCGDEEADCAVEPADGTTVTAAADVVPCAGVEQGEKVFVRTHGWRLACERVACECNLSDREKAVFIELAKGGSARSISDKLCLSYNTVRNYTQRIYEKCAVHSRDELRELVSRM